MTYSNTCLYSYACIYIYNKIKLYFSECHSAISITNAIVICVSYIAINSFTWYAHVNVETFSKIKNEQEIERILWFKQILMIHVRTVRCHEIFHEIVHTVRCHVIFHGIVRTVRCHVIFHGIVRMVRCHDFEIAWIGFMNNCNSLKYLRVYELNLI